MIARGTGLRLSNQSPSVNQLNPSSDNCQTIFKQEPSVSFLPTELRNLLERTVISARDAAARFEIEYVIGRGRPPDYANPGVENGVERGSTTLFRGTMGAVA